MFQYDIWLNNIKKIHFYPDKKEKGVVFLTFPQNCEYFCLLLNQYWQVIVVCNVQSETTPITFSYSVILKSIYVSIYAVWMHLLPMYIITSWHDHLESIYSLSYTNIMDIESLLGTLKVLLTEHWKIINMLRN